MLFDYSPDQQRVPHPWVDHPRLPQLHPELEQAAAAAVAVQYDSVRLQLHLQREQEAPAQEACGDFTLMTRPELKCKELKFSDC